MMQQRQWRCHQKLDWPSAAAATAPTSLISLTAATTTTTATTLTMVMRSAAATVDR